ncbi:MAG: O-methyltransferase [Eubacterium sp.]
MIVNDRIITYMHSLEKSNSQILEQIEQQAHRDNVPIIRKEMESFLRVMLSIKKPKRILELGTAVGYSAILMSEYIESDARIITIENYEKRIPIAHQNIELADKEEVITLLEGDAMEIMPSLESGQFDFVFMDAAKAQYINFLPEVLRLMKSGAVLITDNVLQEGDLIESKYVVRRRDRTIHKRMREYMEAVKNHPQLETSIVPIGDGITVSVKNQEPTLKNKD